MYLTAVLHQGLVRLARRHDESAYIEAPGTREERVCRLEAKTTRQGAFAKGADGAVAAHEARLAGGTGGARHPSWDARLAGGAKDARPVRRCAAC